MSTDPVRQVVLCDSTLRDGNHAVSHQLSAADIRSYSQAAERARLDVLEVGHGNGLGASSLQVGRAALSDVEMLLTAREQLDETLLGVLSLPGFSTVERDLKPALDCGVSIVRVGAHCTEADITQQQITLLRDLGVQVLGVLMMSHMATAAQLLEQARLMESYGAHGVILMDSAGAFVQSDVREKVGTLVAELGLEVGFHAHDNLGLAVANAMEAVDAGATIIDGTARGFGAGAGNAPIELLAANLHSRGLPSRMRLYETLDAAESAHASFVSTVPFNDAVTIVSGLAGVFSGYAAPTRRIARRFGVDPRDMLFGLGERRVIAGQEDAIVDVAISLAGDGSVNGGQPDQAERSAPARERRKPT
jgi:4-hydroxy 2-oxovalerate aldolase